MTDTERLRKDIIDFLEEESFMLPDSLVLMIDAEYADERQLLEIADEFGFKEIRTPVFEHTELFTRSVGDTTDVVQKEMYTFKDKGERSITLRPEGTAGAARAVLEHALENEGLPIKASYFVSCYRYEKPQAGRLREFHQFGVELYGTQSPASDAEVIALADTLIKRLGIRGVSLKINSIGCPECRKKYHAFFHSATPL